MESEQGFPERIGPYRISGRLGAGGMGEVLRGHDDRLDRPVALKRAHPGTQDPEKAQERFRREARAVARLSHPAVVQVYDWVEDEGQNWLVMELVEGRTLDEILADGPLAPVKATATAREVASGLAAAHEAGLVHRDLKAANVIVTPSGVVKILDFGLAKAVEADTRVTGGAGLDSTLTGEGQVVGTIAAMSPEQALGRPVDQRSDLFSLGTLLYEMLSGVSPFEGDSAVETLTRICTAKEKPLERLAPEIPERLARLVAHLLEKEPSRRPSGARHVVAELERLSAPPGNSDSAAETAMGPGSSQEETLLAGGDWSKRRSVVRTLLLSDLVDSTRLVERLGDERSAAVFEQHDRLARRLISEHQGREVDKSDGFLVLFLRPMAAVEYALAYHTALAELARREGVELESRVGIHVGEVVVRENAPAAVARGAKPLEVEGLAKAVAARFMSLARGRQTLVSRGVYDMARRAAVGAESLPEGLRWMEHGRYRMKGVEDPVGVFEVGVREVAPLLPPADSDKAARVVAASDTYAVHKIYGRGASLGALVALIVVGAVGWWSWLRPPAPEPPDAAGVTLQRPLGSGGGSLQLPADEAELGEVHRQAMALLERFDREGNIDRAIELFQALVARQPKSAAAHAGLAQALWRKYWVLKDPRWIEAARPAAERAVELEPYFAGGHVSLGLVRLELGDLEAAEEAFEHAIRLNPAGPLLHRGLGQLYEARGEQEHAELAYRRAVEIRPGAWDLHDRLGTLYFQQSRYDEAAQAFLKSVEAAPDNVAGWSSLSGVYFMQGLHDQAAAELQKAIAIRPHASLYTNLGNIFFYQGLYEQAIAPFRHAVELEEGAQDPLMWGNLGDAYRWAPGHERDARQAYLRGIALLRDDVAARPGDPEIRSRLALYLARSGDCGEALETAVELESSGEIGPGSLFRLVLAYEQCGQRQPALATLGRALDAGFPLVAVEREQELDRLRTDPGFQELRAASVD